MLHILLLVLKIIGIIILCILGLVLLILGIVLFVPVRYRIEGTYDKELIAKGGGNWLLHLVSVQADYNSSVNLREALYRVKIFGFTVRTNLPQKEKKVKNRKKPRNKKKKMDMDEDKKQEIFQNDAKNLEKPENEAKKQAINSVEGAKQPHGVEQETLAPSAGILAEEDEDMPNTGRKKAGTISKIKNKIKALWKKLTNFVKILWEKIRNIPYTIKKMCDRINQLQETVDYYRELWDNEQTRRTVALCKKQLSYLYKKLKPYHFRLNLLFGMDDPYYTGQILAYYGMLYPWLGGNVKLTANFGEQILQGDFKLKGKIRIFTLVKVGIIVYFNKNIRTLLKQIKREEI